MYLKPGSRPALGAWRFELSEGIYRGEIAECNHIKPAAEAEDGMWLLPKSWQRLGTVSCTGCHVRADFSDALFAAVVRGVFHVQVDLVLICDIVLVLM